MAVFISVPLKTTMDVDYGRPLKYYVDILPDLTAETRYEAKESIGELNRLRNRACCLPLERNQVSLDLLMRYYDQLCAIDAKLPMTPSQNVVSFKWKDAFAKTGLLFNSSSSLTINDVAFERAAVLFNVGALLSELAATQKIHTDEELKAMAKLFQQAAGVFARLSETVLDMLQQEPTTDMLPESLAALSALMLAQAQEAIYIKGAKDDMKPSLLVKISMQCAELYRDSHKLMSRESVKGSWDREWLGIVCGKGFAYGALANYHQAQSDKDLVRIGEELARLREAKRLLEQSNSYLPSAAYFPKQGAAIKKALDGATRDNDFIYHEKVPDAKDLAPLPRAVLAKPIAPSQPMSPRFRDLFENFVPSAPQPAMASSGSSLNEPDPDKRLESVLQKSANVKQSGGVAALEAKIHELPMMHRRNEEILNETTLLLKQERESDERLRAQFHAKWTRIPSANLTAPMVQELAKYRGVLQRACKADATVAAKLDDNRALLEKLCQTTVKLIAECSKSADPQSLLRTLRGAHELYYDLEYTLEEGVKFYNDLTPILVRLQQKVADYCFARQTEKDDLMKAIIQRNIFRN